MRIAFHAPMKAQDHPVPSGDRAMARAQIAALTAAGHAVAVASAMRTWCATPDPGAMRRVEAEAEREIERLAATWARDRPPDLWFTYHSYYRAPDLIGPALSARFGLPYVLAEASQAQKRATGPWTRWHATNERAIRAADVHLCFTDRDAAGLASIVAPERILMLPPFLALPEGLRSSLPRGEGAGGGDPRSIRPISLVTAAMMRPGKIRSYAILAEALAALPATLDWRLGVAGDGPKRAAVEAAFGEIPSGRIAWHGVVGAQALSALFAEADLFVWPGYDEPFGVVYLEAQAAGLAVLAMDSGGVASVVEHGRTGLLVREGDVGAYAAALLRLATDPALRQRLGREGRRMVLEERSLTQTAAILNMALDRARAVSA